MNKTDVNHSYVSSVKPKVVTHNQIVTVPINVNSLLDTLEGLRTGIDTANKLAQEFFEFGLRRGTGLYAVQMLPSSEAAGDRTLAIGNGNKAYGHNGFVLGGGNKQRGHSSFCGGNLSETYGLYSFAYGQSCTTGLSFDEAGEEYDPNDASASSFGMKYGRAAIAVGNVVKVKANTTIAVGQSLTAEKGAVCSALFGQSNKITGTYLICTGANNTVAGGYNAVFGQSNVIETANNNVLAFGLGNVVASYSSGSFIGGSYNKVSNKRQFVYGSYLLPYGEGQICLGTYNFRNKDAVLLIGNGTAEDARSNLIEILKSGNVRISGTPEADADLARLIDVKNAIKDLTGYVKLAGTGIALNTSTVGSYGLTVGLNNTSTGEHSIVLGHDNDSTVKDGLVGGINNVAKGTSNIVFGQDNSLEATVQHNFVLGKNVTGTSRGHYRVLLGANISGKTKAFPREEGGTITRGGYYQIAVGDNLISDAIDGQIMVGKFNKANGKAMLVVANGVDADNRLNIFEVLNDGRAKVNGVPKDADDVVRLSDLQTAINELKQLLNI